MRKRLKEKLSIALPPQALCNVYSSFDIIGDIAIIKTTKLQPLEAEALARQILAIHRNIKSVFTQTSAIKSGYRNRELKLLVGENRTVATYKEFGCTFRVDIAQCYFSPRLSHERARIAELVENGETVVNMFAGVGCFSVIIAKKRQGTKVYSIDINPKAFEYMVENIRRNRVYGSVVPLLGDAKGVIEAQLRGVANRVLMPLPELALEYLPPALSALKKGGGWVHFHGFEHATSIENPIENAKQKAQKRLDGLGVSYVIANSRVIRSIGPNWWHLVLDIHVSDLPSKF